MPGYPTPSDYQEAVQFPETAFRDPDLQAARPAENMLGLPQPITGNFAAIFPMTEPTGRQWAAKCFLTDVPDQRARYRAIARHLDEADLPYTVAFDYQAEGIRVEETAYPLLKMEWVDGVPINRFVAEHLDQPEALAALAEAWADLMADLAEAEIAHGDLQHGNILVADEPEVPQIRLVDYDTMYVPALDGRTSAEVGHRNFQHPDRTERDFGLHVDRFAGLVIYTALQACIHRPELWDRFDTGENLLFRSADFYDPGASVLFDTLDETEALAPLADALRTACYVEPEDVPPLADVRSGEGIDRATVQAGRRRSRRDRVEREGLARWFAPGGVGLAVASAAIGWALSGWVALVVLLIGLGLAGGEALRRYRRVPVVRRRRRLEREIEHFTAVIQSLERQIKSLRAKRKEILGSVEERREQRLEEVQEEAIYDRLKHHFIGEVGGVEGITHKHVIRLKADDIRTAYEASPERLKEVRQIGDKGRARIAMWRAGLIAQYEDEIPDTLSPAEERRIQRYVEHRIDDLDDEIARAKAKIQVQDEERTRIRERREEVPELSFGRYLRYLLRLDTLPAPVKASPTGESDEHEWPERSREPVPEPLGDDAPWWRQTG